MFKDINQQINEQSHYVASMLFNLVRRELRRQVMSGEYQDNIDDWFPDIKIGESQWLQQKDAE